MGKKMVKSNFLRWGSKALLLPCFAAFTLAVLTHCGKNNNPAPAPPPAAPNPAPGYAQSCGVPPGATPFAQNPVYFGSLNNMNQNYMGGSDSMQLTLYNMGAYTGGSFQSSIVGTAQLNLQTLLPPAPTGYYGGTSNPTTFSFCVSSASPPPATGVNPGTVYPSQMGAMISLTLQGMAVAPSYSYSPVSGGYPYSQAPMTYGQGQPQLVTVSIGGQNCQMPTMINQTSQRVSGCVFVNYAGFQAMYISQ